MANRSYVIIADSPGSGSRPPGRRQAARRRGRHRRAVPGTARSTRRRLWPRRARHRLSAPAGLLALRYASAIMVLGVVAASSWYTVSGATAFAQMIQP
jgi:hypothetical protein